MANIEEKEPIPIHRNLSLEERKKRRENLKNLFLALNAELEEILRNLEKVNQVLEELSDEASKEGSYLDSLNHWIKVMQESQKSLEEELMAWKNKADEMQEYLESMMQP
jgi:chromosome segregation ATPase